MADGVVVPTRYWGDPADALLAALQSTDDGLTAADAKEAARLLSVLETFASNGGMFPEQIWDAADIPECGLLCRRPSGSAMSLTWAHAEYVRL